MDIDLAELIERAQRSDRLDHYGPMIGRVETYDPTSRRADVRPMVRRYVPAADGSIVVESLPVVPAVPVIHFLSGTVRQTAPIATGTFGLLIVLYGDVSGFMSTGTESDPADLRVHHLASCVFLPGLLPDTSALPQSADPAYVVEASQIKIGAGATSPIAKSIQTDANFATLAAAINTILPGTVTVPMPLTGASKGFVE